MLTLKFQLFSIETKDYLVRVMKITTEIYYYKLQKFENTSTQNLRIRSAGQQYSVR